LGGRKEIGQTNIFIQPGQYFKLDLSKYNKNHRIHSENKKYRVNRTIFISRVANPMVFFLR